MPYGTVSDSRVGPDNSGAPIAHAAAASKAGRSGSIGTTEMNPDSQQQFHNFNYQQAQEGKRCLGIDKRTQRFAMFMGIVTLACVIAFSIVAWNSRTAHSPNSKTKEYPRGGCVVYRTYRTWVQNMTHAGCPQYGDAVPCNTDQDCGLGIPSSCVYGDIRLLVCANETKLCSLPTYSIPRGLTKPAAGVCPIESGDLCGNSFDAVSNSQVNISAAAAEALFSNFSVSAVECVLNATCKPQGRFDCRNLSAIATNYTTN